MHDRAILHGSGNFVGDSPLPLQLELQRTGFVGLHRAGAQPGMKIGSRRQGKPFVGASRRSRGRCFGKHVGLKAAGRGLHQPAAKAGVLQQVTQETGRAGILLPGSFLGVDGQRIPRPGHGDVKQTPLFLLTQLLVIALGNRVRHRTARGELNQGFLIVQGKRARVGTQDKHVRKLEAFGSVRCHHGNRVIVIRRKRNHSAGLRKYSR